MKRFQALGAVLTLAGTFALAACGGGEPDEDPPEAAEAEQGGTVVIVEGADISTPNPIVSTTAFDGNLASDVMNMELVRGSWDAESGRLVHQTADRNAMAIARRYEYVGPDSSVLRFHMRSDLKWSDGQPLTARDVVFTYEMVGQEALASPRQDYVEHLDSVRAETDSTVVFYFARRYPEMLTHSALALVPEHVFRDVAPAEFRNHPSILNPANGNMVVSGPWMIGQWEKGQRVVLVPNPHFQPRPNLDQIVFRVIPEVTTRLVELQTGNVDMVTGVTFDQIPGIRSDAVRFEQEEKRFYDYVAYNPKGHPAFADPEVRRALGLAIDVPSIIQALQMGEYAAPAGGPFSPIFKDLYDPQLTPPLSFDAERARQILESKGWRDTNGDGILDKDGQPFRFTLVTNAGNQRRADAAQIIQQQWRRIGVDAQLQTLEFNTFNQGLIQKTYQAALGGWSVGLSPDLTPLWGPDSPLNITGYRNPQVTSLFQQALAQPTYEAAVPLWKQAAAQISQDQPYTWLWYFDQVDALSERVRGTTINTYGPYQNTWEWWIPSDQRRGPQQTTSTQ